MSKLANKNILVTGGTGLVGSHLIEDILKLNPNQIITLCRSTNPSSYFFSQNLDDKVLCAFGDLKDKERIFDIVTKYEISHIFHIAAQPIVPTAFINPYETLDSNIMGTVNILEAARLSPYTKCVIVASSDKAYGKNCRDATEDFPLSGDHPYDVSKSCADLIARTYYKTYGLPVAVSRCGNIFGPGDLNLNRIIPGIMRSVIKGDALEIRSDGSFKRDYIYVKDVTDGYIALAENIDKIKGEAFNFSSGFNFSVLDLVNKVSKILETEVKYAIANDQKNEILEQNLNFKKADKMLGWKSKFSLDEGIKETYKWYQKFFNYITVSI